MRKKRFISLTQNPRDERTEKLPYYKLLQLPFDDFQVQSTMIDIITKKNGRQIEDFQFLHNFFMKTEFYSSFIRDYGIELAFEMIQNMEYVQLDCDTNLYPNFQTQHGENLYFILNGNVSQVRVTSDIQISQIFSQPEIQFYKRGEAVGQEILQQKNLMQNYTYVTKSRCDLGKVKRDYLIKKITNVCNRQLRLKEKKEGFTDIMEIIKSNDLFDNLGYFDLNDIAINSSIITANHGDFLYQKDHKSKYFYLILEGEIQIISSYSQKQYHPQSKQDAEQKYQNVSDSIYHRKIQNSELQKLNSCSGQSSPVNIQTQTGEYILSTIGKGEFFGLYEFLQTNQTSRQYSTKVCSKAKLLQIKGKILKKLKINNNVSFQRIKKLVFEQKRQYEEREKVSEGIKQNFLKSITEDVMNLDNLKQRQSILTQAEKNSRSEETNDPSHIILQNNNSLNKQFYQLYCHTPYGQVPSQIKMRVNNERLLQSRLSIESVRNNRPKESSEIRSFSSSSHTPRIIFPQNIYETNQNDASISQKNKNNSIFRGYKKNLDIFSTSEDPICGQISEQMNEQMAKNKKRYFIQAMRELEKSSRTNPYTHQKQDLFYNQNSHSLLYNQSIDTLRRSSNARERSIIEKYIKIKRKTEFKTDVEKNEGKQVNLQDTAQKQVIKYQQIQNTQQLMNDISTNTITNQTIDTILSKKILRILPDNNLSHRNIYTTISKTNYSKTDYYYDHPVYKTPSYETQIDNSVTISGKQTPNVLDIPSYFEIISEEDLPQTKDGLSSIKSIEEKQKSHCLSSNKNTMNKKQQGTQIHIENKEETQCWETPSTTVGSLTMKSFGNRSSLSSQQNTNSNFKKNIEKIKTMQLQETDLPNIKPQIQINDFPQSQNNTMIQQSIPFNSSNLFQNEKSLQLKKISQPLRQNNHTIKENKKYYDSNQLNSNESNKNINQDKQNSSKYYQTQSRRLSDQSINLDFYQQYSKNTTPVTQKLCPLLQKSFEIGEQENQFHDATLNELNRYIMTNKKKQQLNRNKSSHRSISVKQNSQPKATNKRVLLII